jgi:putative ABC transport system substrate-binding protein
LPTAFAQQLQTLGWTAGKNLHIDYRWSGGDSQKLQAYAKQLVAARPDVLVTRSTPATAALLHNTHTILVVFAVVSDPVGEGFAKSVARPGGNATGFTNAEASLTSKWVGLLKETKPGLSRIGFIFDPKVAPWGRHLYYTNLIESAAGSTGLNPVPMPFHEAAEVEHAIGDFAQQPNGGLVVLPDGGTNLHRARIIAAAKARLPAIHGFRNLAEMMSYVSMSPSCSGEPRTTWIAFSKGLIRATCRSSCRTSSNSCST